MSFAKHPSKLWVAASQGDVEAVTKRLDEGDSINAREPNVSVFISVENSGMVS